VPNQVERRGSGSSRARQIRLTAAETAEGRVVNVPRYGTRDNRLEDCGRRRRSRQRSRTGSGLESAPSRIPHNSRPGPGGSEWRAVVSLFMVRRIHEHHERLGRVLNDYRRRAAWMLGRVLAHYVIPRTNAQYFTQGSGAGHAAFATQRLRAASRATPGPEGSSLARPRRAAPLGSQSNRAGPTVS
jgi:hypothetical protein